MLRSDHILGGIAIAAGVFLLASSFSIPTSPFVTTLSARFFPRAIAVAMIVLGLVLAFRARPTAAAEALRPLASPRLLGMVAAVAVYFLFFRQIDFRLGTGVFLFVAMWLMGARRPAELILVPVLGAILMWITFRFGFQILLPTWI